MQQSNVRYQTSQMIKEGKFLDSIITSKPTSKYDKVYYDYANKPEDFITHVYQSLKK